MNEMRRRTLTRIGLVALAVPQLAIGIWALASPRGWFGDFPGAGRAWLPFFGPYDEHLVVDVASTFLAIGVVLVLAALCLGRRVVQVAAIGYLVYQLPHAIYHWGADDRLPGLDGLLNGLELGLSLAVALGVLLLSREARPGSAPVRNGKGGVGRLGELPRGLLARGTRLYGRRASGPRPRRSTPISIIRACSWATAASRLR